MFEVVRADEATSSLMTRVLRGRPGLDAEYPTVFGPRARGKVVRSVADGRVESACALLVRELCSPEGVVRIGLIGSVVTAEDRRRRGLAASVLQRAEEELARDGCLAALLWADDEAFYERRGYARIGSEEDFLLERALRSTLPNPRDVRLATAADAARIHALYRDHAQRCVRTVRESADLLAGPGMRVFVRERDGVVDAYACLGRGGDLVSVSHEWGGSVDGLLACLAAAFDASPGDDPLYLIAPLGAAGAPVDGLPRRLRELGVPSAPGVLAMGRLLDPQVARERLERASEGCLSSRVAGDDAWAMVGPSGAIEVGPRALLECLLGVAGERSALDAIEAGTGTTIAGLPLRPFLWGLDSI